MLNNCKDNKIPKYDFPKGDIHLINLGDIHYGNKACNRQFFLDTIKIIKDRPKVYWLSTGDLLEVNTPKSPFFDPDNLTLNKEFDKFIDILRPIASKCLGFVGSNHSNRIFKLSGLNLDSILAKTLNIPYLGITGLINCTLKRTSKKNRVYSYYISMTHGFSGATTLGAKANSVQRLYDMIPNVDLCLEGHTHTYIVTVKEVFSVNRSGNSLVSNQATLCVCGHCLDWQKSYASGGKYQPTPIGFPYITLSAHKKNVSITLLTPNNLSYF